MSEVTRLMSRFRRLSKRRTVLRLARALAFSLHGR
jgi:hypothetical protein